MSNEITTGKIPVNLVNSKTQGPRPLDSSTAGGPKAGVERPEPAGGDRLSMTGDASRLQQLEGVLKNSPRVNSALVAEVSQLIANGRLEINLDRIASNLLEMEAGVRDPQA